MTKKIALSILILLLMHTAVFAIYNGEPRSPQQAQEPTGLIVKFKSGIGIQQINKIGTPDKTGLFKADAINRKYDVKALEPLLPNGIIALSGNRFQNVFILKLKDGVELAALEAEYENLPYVEYAEPDYMVELLETPDDSLYGYQWHLNNTGQEHHFVVRNYGSYNDTLIMTTGVPGADIDAEEMHQNPPDATTTVVVAIIDTGADLDHPDLAANIWINPGEIPDNGIDDDHNGYVDDMNGWDFASGVDPQDPGDNDPTDMVGHGTHCAGIVAAVTNNNLGVAGIATNCKIMALDFDPLPLVSRVAGAIIYAADNGADVISMSFGLNFRSDLIEEAINYARDRGIILCAASGNSGLEENVFPASYEAVMAVGASNDSDQVTTFSTHGQHISVVAPGLSILSLRADKTDIYATEYPREPKVHIIDSLYYLMSGTSMACPVVAGVAAQLRSVSPGLIPARTQHIIEYTADDIIDPYGVGWNYPGWDQYSGHGRVNIFNALGKVPLVRTRITSPIQNAMISKNTQISGIADGDEFIAYTLDYGIGNNPDEWYRIAFSNNPVTDGILGIWDTDGLNGRYTLKLQSGEYNISYASVFIANGNRAEIVSPSDGETVANFASIVANAFAPVFSHFVLEYKSDTALEWSELVQGTIPAFKETIAGWYLENIIPGAYNLRLSLYNSDILLVADTITVNIQSIFETEHAWRVPLGGYPTIIPNYGDFDNDGANEIIVGTSTGIEIYNTDGTRQTDSLPYIPWNNYMIPIAVGNLDGDDIDDFVAIGYNPAMLYGYPSSGEPFETYIGVFPNIDNYFATEHEFPRVSLKDIDNDGLDEIHVFFYNYALSKAFLFKNDGTPIRTFNYYSEYLPVDLDNDGLDEIYTSSRGFGMLWQIEPYTGHVKDSLLISMNGSNFFVMGMSGYDIDKDSVYELIVYGYYYDFGYWIYAFEEGLNLIDGWPHDMAIDNYVVPTVPILGDLDGDTEPEYLTTFFDISASYVLAWHLDGSPYLPGSYNGLLATSPEPSVMNMLLLADMDADGGTDVISCADNDMFNTFNAQRIYAWDNEAKLLTGFPIVTVSDFFTSDRFTPAIGDINGDGNVDMIMTTPDEALIFVNFPETPYNLAASPVPSWRYNRRMNNLGQLPGHGIPTDFAGNDTRLIPGNYELLQNYPNPFNPMTWVEYSLPAKSHVELVVYNILGQKVKTLVDAENTAGKHIVSWDGRNDNGSRVSSGIYFYSLKSGDFSETRKMMFLR